MADEQMKDIAHLRELVDVREKALNTALELQAREYERRLAELNHYHARAIDAANKSVLREVYDADQKSCYGRHNATSREIEVLRREVSVDLARRAGRAEILAAFAVFVSIISPFLIRFLIP